MNIQKSDDAALNVQTSDDATLIELPHQCPNCQNKDLILEILTNQFSIRVVCLNCDSESSTIKELNHNATSQTSHTSNNANISPNNYSPF